MKKGKRLYAAIAAVCSFALLLPSLSACGKGGGGTNGSDGGSQSGGGGGSFGSSVDVDLSGGKEGVYTYRIHTSSSPSNWNELTYQDSNDRQVMDYMSSPFFEYDFAFDEQGEIIKGDFKVNTSAATGLLDVTEQYAGNQKYAVPQGATSGYAYQINLREDLKWEDGTPIRAADFVYTMSEQLNPLFKNYRADSFFGGALVLHKAKDYVYQGSEGWFASTVAYQKYDAAANGKLVFSLGEKEGAVSAVREEIGLSGSASKEEVLERLNAYGANATKTALDMEGKTVAEILNNPTWKGEWDKLNAWLSSVGYTDTPLYFTVTKHLFPKVDFSEVGIFVGNKATELIIVLDQPLYLLEKDGSIGYKAAYNLSSLPLVHKAKYEANKKAPVEGAKVWTSTYNSGVESSASWGPYKLTGFQPGKYYRLDKNENWYGWKLEQYKDQYQTDSIVCETVSEWQTAWMMFLQGGLDTIGLDVSVASDYKNGDRAYFTPSDYVGSLQFQSNHEALENRQKSGINKTILSKKSFRKALSLGIDRADFTAKTTAASMAGFGLFGSMHYFDVEAGADGLYRNTAVAKETLCEIFGVDVDEFSSLDEAVEAITGYDPSQAKGLITYAYYDALSLGEIGERDKVVLTFGSAVDNSSTRRVYNYLNEAWKELMVGTPLEGRFELEFDASFGSKWAIDFRAGAYDICAGGWRGAAWDPGYFLAAYLDPNTAFSASWDTAKENLKLTVRGLKEGDSGIEITNDKKDSVTLTLPLFDEKNGGWYQKLNGVWGDGALDDEFRVDMIAGLEKEVLGAYYSVPYSAHYTASLASYKTDYITYDYNTFMGYGGVRYLRYHYDDAAWAKWVSANKVGGEIDYK